MSFFGFCSGNSGSWLSGGYYEKGVTVNIFDEIWDQCEIGKLVSLTFDKERMTPHSVFTYQALRYGIV